MELVLENRVSKQQTVITGLTDLCTNALFYQFNINLPQVMLEGEYEYQLMDGEDILARGILQIGDYTPQNHTYQENNNTYIVYNG